MVAFVEVEIVLLYFAGLSDGGVDVAAVESNIAEIKITDKNAVKRFFMVVSLTIHLLRTFLPSVIYNGEKGQSGTDFLDFSKNMKIFAKAVPFTVFVPL